jgi:Fe-S cluster assembly scaffold protein SufB
VRGHGQQTTLGETGLEPLLRDAIAKRGRGKPARRWRSQALARASRCLIDLGYRPSRNEASEWESASSIISAALQRLGKPMSEKRIAEVVREVEEQVAAEVARQRWPVANNTPLLVGSTRRRR